MEFLRTVRKAILFFLLFPEFFIFSQSAPRWFTNRDAVYPPSAYITGLGDGRTAEDARSRALVQISMYFNTAIQAQTELLETYQETSRNGKTSSSQSTAVSEAALVDTRADFFGVTFEPPYTDRSKTVYVLAKINRSEALAIYNSRIQDTVAQANGILAKNENSANPYAALNRLRAARSIADLAASYAAMAVLIDSASSSRHAAVPALISSIDKAAEDNKKRMTVTITLNEERARSLSVKTAEILRGEGFLVVDSGGTYTAVLDIKLNENKTQNYNTVQPLVDITLKLRNGEPLARFQKDYAVYRHVNLNDALLRALRNIEQDFSEEFIIQLRRIEE